MSALLEQFLQEQGIPHLRDRVGKALHAGRRGEGPRRGELTFNRFSLTFDIDTDEVVVEDDINFFDVGEERMTVDAFLALLAPGQGA